MNRLQKKCVIVTAGLHLLLLVILFVGPAFFNPRPKVDNSQVIDVIPPILIDDALNSGVNHAQPPPAPQPVVQPQPQQQPTPPTPKPVVQPAPAPQPTLVQKIETIFKPEPKPEPEKQTSKPVESQPHKIQPSLVPVVRNVSKISTPAKPKDDSRVIKNIADALRHNLSSPTEVSTPGESSEAFANYDSVVKSIYDRAWTLPDSIANDDENVKVTVTIARDGTVISASIVTPSGDASMDNSVQRTLDRVRFIAPFPEGATDKERTYTINFNPKLKRLSE